MSEIETGHQVAQMHVNKMMITMMMIRLLAKYKIFSPTSPIFSIWHNYIRLKKLCNRVWFNLSKPQSSLYTTSFKRQKFCVLPTMHLCVLCGSQNKLRIFPAHSINVSVFITKAESVYCAVRAGSLNQTDTISS
jgi:hypothetical protein